MTLDCVTTRFDTHRNESYNVITISSGVTFVFVRHVFVEAWVGGIIQVAPASQSRFRPEQKRTLPFSVLAEWAYCVKLSTRNG